MPQQNYTMKITRDLRPSYYDKFHCLAEACRISCCKGWHITFHKKDYLSLKRQNGSPALNEQIAHGLRRLHKTDAPEYQYAEFALVNGRCPLQREDCLCQLQIEKGHDALPFVCQSFPRVQRYMPSGYLERSLSPACEGVLALLWDLSEGIEFYSDPISDEEKGTYRFDNLPEQAAYFHEIRSWCIDMLQDRRHSLPERIMRMGAALRWLYEGESNIANWLENARALMERRAPMLPSQAELDHMLPLFLSNNLRLLVNSKNELDVEELSLRDELVNRFVLEVHVHDRTSMTSSNAPWLAARQRYEEVFGNQDYFMENVMVSLFFFLNLPSMDSLESLWKGFVNFCNFYSFHRFMAVMSCREGINANRDELFQSIVFACRTLLHNGQRQKNLRDEFFEHDSATLAHMAVLLSG